jgi:hypothetical protein
MESMSFDKFCEEEGISGGEKEEFLEFCAEQLDLGDDVETIPDQTRDWFDDAYADF